MRTVWMAFALISPMLGAAVDAHAQKRVALVIGNSAYKNVSELPNPRSDAADLAVALKDKGFVVSLGVELDKSSFIAKLRWGQSHTVVYSPKQLLRSRVV